MTTSAEPKEYWLNIYDWPPHPPYLFWHESRAQADEFKSEHVKLLYRIHVRLK